jgi:N-acetyl-gamma-glutamyl-phosphate/LysW-gamma-L-alpha-aminoadipyl-6-phosphate reductase
MGAGKRYRAAVMGGSGYGGAELVRRLLLHPDVELVRVASIDLVGEPLSAADPALEGRTELVLEDLTPAEAARGVDVVLLGLPHGVSATKVPALVAVPGLRVVDMSGDFRLRDPAAYARAYGRTHPAPELLADFTYGLPEVARGALAKARLAAAPGCFATAITLALLPLARAGLLQGIVHVQGITGSSGSGAAPSAATHHPVRAGNLRAYKPMEHQHVPEIEQTLLAAGARDLALRFVPVSAPLGRGILATAFVELPEAYGQARLDALLRDAFAGEPFVRVPRRRLPEVAAVSGSNFAEVGAVAGPARGGLRTVALLAALDNLVKGGAGQAIQGMNVMLGLDETASLADPGPWPP